MKPITREEVLRLTGKSGYVLVERYERVIALLDERDRLRTVAGIQESLQALTEKQRLEAFEPFCHDCGGPAYVGHPYPLPCQCWNDE